MLEQDKVTKLPTDNPSIFYDGAFYDRIFQSSPRYLKQSQDVLFWLNMAECYGPSILELACGTGRISVPLGDKGFDVTGIELSDSMLKAAGQKSESVQWLQKDVRDFNLKRRFSLIIFPYDTFTHLHELPDVKSCLHCVKQHLEPDGYFIIDFKNPYCVFDTLNAPNSQDIYSIFQDPHSDETVTAMRESKYDAAEQLYHRTLTFSWENTTKIVQEVLTLRIYFPKEIEAILTENGFTVVQKFGNYEEAPFGSNTSHHILVCQKTL